MCHLTLPILYFSVLAYLWRQDDYETSSITSFIIFPVNLHFLSLMFFLREKYNRDGETKSSQAADRLCFCSVFKLDLLQVCG